MCSGLNKLLKWVFCGLLDWHTSVLWIRELGKTTVDYQLCTRCGAKFNRAETPRHIS